MDYIKAFLVGGALCLIGQILIDKTKLTPARILVSYVVAGVVAVDEDELYKTAYGTGNRMYMMYETLKEQHEELKVTCYEAVMPNPISNYAFYALKSACGQNEMEETQ